MTLNGYSTRQLALNTIEHIGSEPKYTEEGRIQFEYQGVIFLMEAVNECMFVNLIWPWCHSFSKFDIDEFARVRQEMGCPDLKALGAYIPRSFDYPLHDHIILIGDAGGFPNRLTFEGIYYAFLTAQHAVEAIATHTPFSVVNKQVFLNKKKEERIARLFYSPTGLWLLKVFCRLFPSLIISRFNKASF